MGGKTLKLFITGNSPRSLKKITEFNWSGHAFYGKREQINQLSKRREASSTGLYFLLSDINSETVSLYVGETDNFINRLKNHNQNKSWWTHFIVFQSDSNNLNKAHVKYLESVFYNLAELSTEIDLKNEQKPSEIKLSEEDLADIELFKENILYILEALNLGYFSRDQKVVQGDLKNATYDCSVPNSNYKAMLIRYDDYYILKKGSYIRSTAVESFESRQRSYFKIWQKIIKSDKVNQIEDDIVVLKEDIEFSSPSAAAAIVNARSSNGRTCWKNTESGKTMKQEEEQDLKDDQAA